jgi:diaminopimelate dehydrogenase
VTRVRIAVVGLGRLGRACAEAARDTADVEVCGIWRRESSLAAPLPPALRGVAVAGHVSELPRPQAALVCVPTDHALSVATELAQHRIPFVECATLGTHALEGHYAALDRLAGRHRVPAVVGAGWSPGVLQGLSRLFDILVPRGRTELTDSPGLDLRHTELARGVPGVRRALAAAGRTPDGRRQHYFYVELEPGHDVERVRAALALDPALADHDVLVFPVDSVAALEDRGHGVLLERIGMRGKATHETLLLEGRFDVHLVTARLMLHAALQLPTLAPGAHRFTTLPM